MNMLTDDMIKKIVRSLTFPLKPFLNDDVMTVTTLRPNTVSNIAYLIHFALSEKRVGANFASV
jgi:hypothetical protein